MQQPACHNRIEPKGMSPVALAFVGDSVYELLVRGELARLGGRPPREFHRLAVARVRATAQAALYERLWAAATADEREILRRGRNVSLSRMPASCTPEQYHKATALEALFGYLYLAGEQARLEELFGYIKEAPEDGN